jgi:hypothetical protein
VTEVNFRKRKDLKEAEHYRIHSSGWNNVPGRAWTQLSYCRLRLHFRNSQRYMIIGLIDNCVCIAYCDWSKSSIFSIKVHKITTMAPASDGLQTVPKKYTRVELLNKILRRSARK